MKASLLIVDDEREIRDALARHFRFLDYDIDTAENGRVALENMALKKYDVVISDIVMPELDGVALLRAVRHDYPMVRVIMITGYVTQEHVMACLRHSAEACIFKPWHDLREIETAVHDAVARIQDWKNKMRQLIRMNPERECSCDER